MSRPAYIHRYAPALIVLLPLCGPGPEQPDQQSSIVTETRDGYRYITSNGLPDHETGQFPNPGNPGHIAAQTLEFRIPLRPAWSDAFVPTHLEPVAPGPRQHPIMFGVAVNGVVFDPTTAGWWNDDRTAGWHIEAIAPHAHLGLDANHAHVQPPPGLYHYHGIPTGLVDRLTAGRASPAMTFVGWAADGFPIYARWGHDRPLDPSSAVRELTSSYRLKVGGRPGAPAGPGGPYDGTYTQDYEYVPGSGDLDECNGRYGVTPEFPRGTYYYILTGTFPFVPRYFRATPDESFRKTRPDRPARP